MGVEEMIAEGMYLVQNDPLHDLIVGFRCRLISSFDEIGADIGRRRRVKLGEVAVRKVLPVWESLFPTDRTACRALELANNLLAGTILPPIAEKETGRMWSHCDDLSWKHPEKQSVVMVGYGAIQVVREALSARHFGCGTVSSQSTDKDVDPYDHDTAFCAVIAYSGGAAWDKASDSQKRLEFWTWWLSHAVPIAVDNA
jgi:hypothetical protein